MKAAITSWADEVEADYVDGLPPSKEYVDGDYKHVTEYKFNDEGKKIKVVRSFKIEKKIVSRAVAKRRNWVKFGDSKLDKPGPNSYTTKVADEILMNYMGSKDFEHAQDPLDAGKPMAKCRICNGEHWSVKCPYKGTSMDMESKAIAAATAAVGETNKTGKYVPPFLKDGAKGRERDDSSAVRISNLSESMTEDDLEELVKKIGPYTKMYLAREKNSGLCKGFAYVHFKYRKDAAEAIEILNGHGYDHLILSVEWSKPQN
ncbi:eukaryotic translation initiation factor 3 subunit G-2 [Drosophila novamexicana]|uniref:Eukaryotic translation initiation factor 3 subunit G-2 n=2 Tax=Drosophila virilis TaxID=7244 RepID=EI3G2_DROVI|nr:eukaryotic translation initiation factor 3 subunit G-2 [Drosophila virilis]XP_015027038.1 eukaryotic translation initiation factor 3 subunit G-2 [Drosophila virilis]XP_030554001.1 eukaryotic translation initiation factor 3 subunit G-2 [Drosophila novamexicana]XP_030554003.1 eukaryotic translation initiation factor 3 subunit G-2 [Drosophila novamexicana]B4LVR8.1 RecName: Full=Eukaryotic translation initiation factor 3 subunit G-2; AltName: Full=Eukaryotic translation initiation factor 3 RNA-b